MGNLPLDHAAQCQDATLGIGNHGQGIARSSRRQLLDRLAQAGDGAVCGTGFPAKEWFCCVTDLKSNIQASRPLQPI
jgi:hypothetical protein